MEKRSPRALLDCWLERFLADRPIQCILHFFRRPCKDLQQFDEFCQDVVVQAIEEEASCRGRSDAERIQRLRAIGRQVAVDNYRRASRRKYLPVSPEQADHRIGLPIETAIQKEEHERQRANAERLLASLSPEDRSLLERHLLGGQRLRGIAEELGIQGNTLVQRYNRLLQRLREHAAEIENFPVIFSRRERSC
jgi:RNA polymerase sigma factor (sigma-70 family)